MTKSNGNLSVRVVAAIMLIVAIGAVSSPASAALVLWEEPAVSIAATGDTIVRTEGNLVEAINFTPNASPTVRTVNTVPFATQTTGLAGWNNPVFAGAIYNGGGISPDFVAIMDSFMFGDTPANPGTETLTLGTFSSLVVGEKYLLQLFISDDRTVALGTRTQDYAGGGNQTALYANSLGYSLTGMFIADATTQAIQIRAFPGNGQTTAAPIVNAYQVRLIPVPEPSTLLVTGMAFALLAIPARRRSRQIRGSQVLH